MVIVCWLLSLGAVAQTKEPHPIEVELDQCLNSDAGVSTLGMRSCYATAMEAWDTELNRVYQALRAELNEEEKEALLIAQRAWLAYRDSDFAFSKTMHANMQGTLWALVHDKHRMEVVRARTLELQGYLFTLTEP